MSVTDIINKYELIESKNLYNKAVEILELVTDEELEDIFATHPTLFAQITNVRFTEEDMVKHREFIRQAIDIFVQTIESRSLTQDEFSAMTLDDVKEYLNSLIIQKSPILLQVIREMERLRK